MAREFTARWKSVGAEKVARDFEKVGKGAKDTDKALGGINDTGTRTKRRLDEVGLGLKDLAKGFLAFQGITFLKDSITQAADFETGLISLNKVVGDVVVDDIQEWSEDNADALNLSQSATLDAANAFAVYASAIQDAGGDAADFTTDMTTLAAELASLNGANPDEVITALGAALRGEFDPLERFGIALKASDVSARALALGLAETEAELTGADKAMATYNLLMERGAFAMGATEAAAGTFSGTMADLRQKVEDLTLELGQSLLPAAQFAATALGGLVSGFSDLPGPIQQTLTLLAAFAVANKLFGKQIGSVGSSLRDAFSSLRASTGAVQTLDAVEVGIGGVTKNLGPMTVSLTRGERALQGFSKAGRGALAVFGGPWVVGITAAIGVVTAIAASMEKARQQADDFATSLADIGSGSVTARLDLLNDTLEGIQTGWTRRWFSDMDTAADALDELGSAGISLADLDTALNGTETQFDALIERLQDIAKWNDEAWADDATAQQREQAAAADILIGVLDGLRGGIGRVADAEDRLSGATEGVSDELDVFSLSAEDVATMVDDARKAVDGLIDSFTVLSSTLEVRDSLYEYREDLRELSEELANGELTFSPDSEAGKANWDALVEAAQTADSRIQAILAEEGPAAAAAAWEDARAEIGQILADAGIEAEGLLDQVFGKEYTIDASFNEISTAEAETGLTEAIQRLKDKIAEIDETRLTIEADPTIPSGAKAEFLSSLADEKMNVSARLANKQDLLNELAGLSPEQKIQVGAELIENGGNVRKAIKAVTDTNYSADIDVGTKGNSLTQTGNAIKDVADGPYNADIDVDDVGTTAASLAIDAAAKDRYTTIWVTERPTGGGRGGDNPETRSMESGFERMAAMAMGTPYIAGTYPGQPFYKGTPSSLPPPVSAPEKTAVAPKRNAVKVYLDGAEIASHLDLNADRLVAAATTRRRA